MMQPAITVDRLVFEYPGVRALDDVSFSIERGSITALVGPNGAGKTTLLRCIAGLDLPLSGDVRVDGIDVQREPRACHRHLGYLSDSFGLYENLSVRRCLRYSAEANGLAPASVEPAVKQTAERLGLADRLEQKAGELSRGLQQRVAIGQAIIHGPLMVLLDEPAAGLDPEARHELSSLFRHLRADGLTLLVSSHILAELAEYSTHMLVLQAGRLVDHRTVIGQASASTTLELQLSAAVADARRRLEVLPGVSNVRADTENRVCFDFAGNLDARHQLLRTLIDAGLPICGLQEVAPDMQSAYLDSICAARRNES
ncbi:ABC transporter ATP-binding protein [Methyloterricola oryzae]|uniref:ABC transporter ATP-binding protein n=1 Tax=Methyloterricola oryzae TaxID=1495050 RepID=UPI000A55205B|nr:ABC transporter ATP-binding protein [Methyloterricola oryzae]